MEVLEFVMKDSTAGELTACDMIARKDYKTTGAGKMSGQGGEGLVVE